MRKKRVNMTDSDEVQKGFSKEFSCTIDPNLPLHRHLLFWAPIVFFVLPAIYLSVPTWCFCWPELKDYEYLVKQQGFPIFIASLAIPFTVIVNRFHASSQRAESNRIANQNMAFNHYFDHKKHFLEHCNLIKLDEPFCNFIKITNTDKLYKLIFPLNLPNFQDMSCPIDIVKLECNARAEVILSSINKELSKNPNDFDANVLIEKIGSCFGISIDNSITNYVKQGARESESILALCFYGILDVLQKAGHFSHFGFERWMPTRVLEQLFLILNDKRFENINKLFVKSGFYNIY